MNGCMDGHVSGGNDFLKYRTKGNLYTRVKKRVRSEDKYIANA